MSVTRLSLLPCPECRGAPGNPCIICGGTGAFEVKRFVSVRRAIMYGEVCVAVARSKTMAKRIAKALNEHVANREGV